jgi:hypothetical protein
MYGHGVFVQNSYLSKIQNGRQLKMWNGCQVELQNGKVQKGCQADV